MAELTRKGAGDTLIFSACRAGAWMPEGVVTSLSAALRKAENSTLKWGQI